MARAEYESGVDRLHVEFERLRDFFQESGAPQYLLTIEDVFPKTMLLAAASYFETRLCQEVEQLAKDATSDDHVVRWLVTTRVIKRQYHDWFAWDGRNANRFFSMFGKSFKDQAEKWVNEDDQLRSSIVDFLKIGHERNQLVHGNFSDFKLERTSNEVFELYDSAKSFVDWFPTAVRRYSERPGTAG